jgi:hypothetical protein
VFFPALGSAGCCFLEAARMPKRPGGERNSLRPDKKRLPRECRSVFSAPSQSRIRGSSVVERSAVNRLVVGSNPTPGAMCGSGFFLWNVEKHSFGRIFHSRPFSPQKPAKYPILLPLFATYLTLIGAPTTSFAVPTRQPLHRLGPVGNLERAAPQPSPNRR